MTKSMTFQIVQDRYDNGDIIEDTWCVLYEIAAQAIEAFNQMGAARMFQHADAEATYYVRGLDRNYVATGETYPLAGADRCIDCDGAGRYPSEATCKSCGGSGLVLKGDGETIDDEPDLDDIRDSDPLEAY